MSETTNNLINLPDLPDSVDNALQNLTDKPCLSVGTTFSDLWDLVFGPISYLSEKRRIKYAHNLELFRKQLESSIDQIPSEKAVEPSIQTTAQALENSKYCIDEKNLREMFIALISNSMNSDYQKDIHPSFAEILKQMSPLDAEILKDFKGSGSDGLPICQYNLDEGVELGTTTLLENVFLNHPSSSLSECSLALSSLTRLGLLTITYDSYLLPGNIYSAFEEHSQFIAFREEFPNQQVYVKGGRVFLTPLGHSFVRTCIPD